MKAKSQSSWTLMLTAISTLLLYSFWYSIVTYHPSITRPSKEIPEPEGAHFYIREHGEYWILYNYITGTRIVGNSSITLTTHAEYTDLEEIVRLAQSWTGAISVAIYATGTDFAKMLKTMHYLNDCSYNGKHLRLATNFHVVVHKSHMPSFIPKPSQLFQFRADCNINVAKGYKKSLSYRAQHNFLYPTNVLRNVARSAARTFHVFPLDLTVYPSAGFINHFQYMQQTILRNPPPKTIYCFPLFRMKSQRAFPMTKEQLLSLVAQDQAQPVAQATEMLPELMAWLGSSPYNLMGILKTLHKPVEWNPYFVGVNDEIPVYDERVSGRNLNFALMQRLDYHIHIMDGAFLIQKPSKKIFQKQDEVHEINIEYLNQLLVLYGDLNKDKATATII